MIFIPHILNSISYMYMIVDAVVSLTFITKINSQKSHSHVCVRFKHIACVSAQIEIYF